jgi:protein arginine kinase activator
MLCENCKQKDATVSFSEVKNHTKIEHRLCEDCAQNYSPYIAAPAFSHSLQSILGQFLEAVVAKAEQEESKIKCEHCGISYHEFRKQGRLGCEHDYDSFAESLGKLVHNLQGSDQHTGKKPHVFAESEKKRVILAALQEQLQIAVAAERYEEAAKIRDQIRATERQHHGV